MSGYHFIDENGTFTLEKPDRYTGLYFPIANETGLKSAFTPNLGGDAKLDQNTFLLPPESIEDLHSSKATRNFWCAFSDGTAWSATGVSAEAEAAKFTEEEDESSLTAGFLWQTIFRKSKKYGISATLTSFLPVKRNVEVLIVRIKNESDKAQTLTPIAAIPIYGRSADNLRDHRHVTSLLHRTSTFEYGVKVRPTLSFDERGHLPNENTYYVMGVDGDGRAPEGFYPVVEEFLGEGGSYLKPRAVYETLPARKAGDSTIPQGRESIGALRFSEMTLGSGEEKSFVIFLGVTKEESEIDEFLETLGSVSLAEAELFRTKEYWFSKVNVSIKTGDRDFDNLMRWVFFQPVLRRIYGCSFLPHHDYGRGGRGWRDLWQDCLALLLMEPEPVGRMLKDNFRGVRVDGTNATIIGSKPGEFKADRNGIMRVWMDHGFWTYLTTRLYLDQTGDVSLLSEKIPYFKDSQILRGTARDESYAESQGSEHLTASGEVYEGTILEHLLIQNLTSYFEVGEHGELRLRGADWNDALDMAADRGESVAFTAAYALSLAGLAETLTWYGEKTGVETIEVLEELAALISTMPSIEDDPMAKNEVLHRYAESVRHTVSGKKVALPIAVVVADLREKSNRIKNRIRQRELVSDDEGHRWFNSYYDNHGNPVEGKSHGDVRMMLTGQVFTVMSGTADEAEVDSVIAAADTYLFSRELGGYRLNTDFHEVKEDLGRMFGFAYGEKENGAVFSHMAVMYAYALFSRGRGEAGEKALRALSDAALYFETSRIYPGIPEYFRGDGRGMYHYLTGAASWYLLTVVTKLFGVSGKWGDLEISPMISEGEISLVFANRPITVKVRAGEHRHKLIARDELLSGTDALTIEV